ncbi:hypothetical protein [Zhongshania sp.]|uniref:hypothetical protein n=1 Tax=Zhongshania sp. TaxID=1971902 RepID=UPI003567D4E2
MLIASYLLGYDDDGSVRHIAVDNILPDVKQGFDYTLYPRESSKGLEILDLVLLFAEAEEPRKAICLPNLPGSVVSHLLSGTPLQIIDFAYGRVVRLSFDAPTYHQRCA